MCVKRELKPKAEARMAHYVCNYQSEASRIAFSGIFDGSLKSGRPLESGSGAGRTALRGLGLVGSVPSKEAQAAAEVALSPRCPSATRSASCFLLVGDSLLLVLARERERERESPEPELSHSSMLHGVWHALRQD
jgi:hypothetical protein